MHLFVLVAAYGRFFVDYAGSNNETIIAEYLTDVVLLSGESRKRESAPAS